MKRNEHKDDTLYTKQDFKPKIKAVKSIGIKNTLFYSCVDLLSM